MRPDTIIWFERIYIASLAIAAASIVADWEELARPISPELALAVMGGTLLLCGLLVLLVSRIGSRIAKWLLVGLLAFGVVSLAAVAFVIEEPPDMAWYDMVVWIMQGAATALMFTPSAREWMRRRRDPKAARDGLERTFE